MLFKFRPFQEYSELSGVIGKNGCPYWILKDVVSFLQYSNCYRILREFKEKKIKESGKIVLIVRDVAPFTVLGSLNKRLVKEAVCTFEEMLQLMIHKHLHFRRVQEFLNRFQTGHLAEPVPDWKEHTRYIVRPVSVNLDDSRPMDLPKGAPGTMQHWLEMYTKTVKDYYTSNVPLPLNNTENIPLLKALLKHRALLKKNDGHPDGGPSSQREDRDCGVSSSMSPRPKDNPPQMPPPPPKKGFQKTPNSPTTQSALGAYSVQSPAVPEEQCSVPSVKYVPVMVNEEYLVEAPESVPPPLLLDKEGDATETPCLSGLFQGNGLQRAQKLNSGSEVMEESELPSEEDGDEPRAKRSRNAAEEPWTVSVKQNRRKQTHPMRMLVNQPLVLPKIHIQAGGVMFALGVTLCLDKLCHDAVEEDLCE